MAKERVGRKLSPEQWERIINTPGVVVHERKGPPASSLPEPTLRVKNPISARELTGRDLDYDEEDEHLTS
jgi:hypothetical protein